MNLRRAQVPTFDCARVARREYARIDATRMLHLSRPTRRARWRRTVRANDALKMVEEHEFATWLRSPAVTRARLHMWINKA